MTTEVHFYSIREMTLNLWPNARQSDAHLNAIIKTEKEN